MSKLKVLVTGGSSLVGSRFIELAKNYQLSTPEYPEFDITNANSVAQAINQFNPEWIINFAEYADIITAEEEKGDEKGQVWKTNVEGVKNLLKAFPSNKLIQISTDKVFPGNLENPGPYAENDKTSNTANDLTWYGWTKNRAEKEVLSHTGTILRIINPVGTGSDKNEDLIRLYLKKFSDGTANPLFHDQQTSVTMADEAVETIQKIIDTNTGGIFHCSSDTTSPFELISYVVDKLDGDPTLIKSVSIESEKNKKIFPEYGGLKTVQTENKLSLHFSAWQTILEKLIAQGLSLR